jgi:pimeloyl-ACP methyl ester carboxylesterase
MPYELPPDPSTARRARITGWLTFAVAAILVAVTSYLGYVGYEGSRQLTDAPAPTTDCRTPETLGWTYEAVNYDVASDARLASEPDPTACSAPGALAGEVVTGPGDVGLAGWYIPADAAGPSGPTVVLVHGWGSNKSQMLDRAAPLRGTYNLLLVDMRNHGQSAEAPTTQGVREAGDLVAMLDWLEAEKAPERVAVLGVSMGGATALATAARDERIDALIVESTHATLAGAIQARLDGAGYPLSMPGSWATLLGTLLRTGEDTTSIDPLATIDRMGDRPVLLVYGGQDASIGATDPADLRDAAADAAVPVELQVCADAGHAGSPEACAEDYASWVLGFLDRTIGPSG